MTTTTAYTVVPSVGALVLTAAAMPSTASGSPPAPVDPAWRRDDPAFAEAARQLAEYFAGERRAFDLPLAPAGTPFQRQV